MKVKIRLNNNQASTNLKNDVLETLMNIVVVVGRAVQKYRLGIENISYASGTNWDISHICIKGELMQIKKKNKRNAWQ